jgi:hypothetical protein
MVNFDDVIDLLLAKLEIEKQRMTGSIKEDMRNGSFYNIKKIYKAISAMLDDPIRDRKIKMEFGEDTWRVEILDDAQDQLKSYNIND